MEQRIDELEEALRRTARLLEQAGTDVERVRTLGREYADLERALHEQIETWERLQSGIEPA